MGAENVEERAQVIDGVAGGYVIGKDDYGKCPLCRRKWQNPAILESGWVVCWRCGWDAIQGDGNDDGEGGKGAGEGGDKDRKGRCPITGVEVSKTDLRRVLL
jgi:peroxin-12